MPNVFSFAPLLVLLSLLQLHFPLNTLQVIFCALSFLLSLMNCLEFIEL